MSVTGNLSKKRAIDATNGKDGVNVTRAYIQDEHLYIVLSDNRTLDAGDLSDFLVSAALTGIPTAPTAEAGTKTKQIATTEFVGTAVSDGILESDALVYKGTVSSLEWQPNLPEYDFKTGWAYKAIMDGIYAGYPGIACKVGDMLIAKRDCPMYDSSKAYLTGDCVYYNGSYYEARRNVAAGTAPTSTYNWNSVEQNYMWDVIQGKLTDGYITTDLIADDAVTADKLAEAVLTTLNGKAPLTSPVLTGTPTAPTASAGTNTKQIATTEFVKNAVDNGILESDALIFKGVLNAPEELPDYDFKTGWTYRIGISGTYGGNIPCEIGDMIIAKTDCTLYDINKSYSAGDCVYYTPASNWFIAEIDVAKGVEPGSPGWTWTEIYHIWDVLQTNIDGAVTGPVSAVSNKVAVFSGNTGKVIKDSGKAFTDTVSDNDALLPTAGAVVDYVGGALPTSLSEVNTSEGEKLGGIAEGAQVNVIESVKVNGTALAVTDKAVDVPVVGIKGTGTSAEVFNGGSASKASGNYSHTEGYNTSANGYASHVEGYSNNASANGFAAHVEGSSNTASGNSAHAEGSSNTASGDNSHAEGNAAVASGKYSHAGGNDTIANHASQYVYGSYNVADTSAAAAYEKGNYVRIVGNGAYNARSNAETLDWSGNHWVAGKASVGNTTPTADNDLTSKLYVDAVDALKQNKPSQVTTGTNITIADNTEYRLTNVSTLTFTYPTGNFECYIRFTTAASGAVTITFPASSYIGSAPNFSNGETWEVSIKDGIIIAAKVGDGT